jgi:hypothetical protein
MDTLRALAGEVSRRGQELERLGTDTKVTREMAERDPSMRPRIVVFDEVHELFTHPEHGKEAKELALKVTKKARKTAIMLLWITPDADAASLPRGISKTVSHGSRSRSTTTRATTRSSAPACTRTGTRRQPSSQVKTSVPPWPRASGRPPG